MLRVALGQYDTGWHDPAISLARAGEVVRAGADEGAQLIALPEMCTTGFTMHSEEFAEPIDGTSIDALRELATEEEVHLLAGVALRGDDGAAYNAALLLGPDGAIEAQYRKQRLFAFAGEHGPYSPGSEAPPVVTVGNARISFLVCYDLRFPELFRDLAADVDAFVIIANWPASRREHWLTLLRARAIENQCYVIGVNRSGTAGGLEYSGDSVAFDPWGEPISNSASIVGIVDVDPARVEEIRSKFPFLRDR